MREREKERDDSRAVPPVCPIIACAAQWCQPSHPEAEHGEVFGRNSFLSSTWRRESVNEWMEGEGRKDGDWKYH